MTPTNIRELAKTLDVPPADALRIAREQGVQTFWHEGRRFNLHQLDGYLKREWLHDPRPELEFEGTAALDGYVWRFEAEQIISEAAVEIENAYGPDNIVAQRCRDTLRRVAG